VLVELILDIGWELPQRHRRRSVEELLATRARDSEYNSRLSEAVCPRKAAFKRNRSIAAEHAVGVPPSGSIHLAMSGNGKAELQEPVEVKRRVLVWPL
jgi:hypothetical protein